jgi:hypothetical protein
MLQEANVKAKSFLINIAQPYMAGQLTEDVFVKQLKALPIEVCEEYKKLIFTMPIESVRKARQGQLTLNEIEAM